MRSPSLLTAPLVALLAAACAAPVAAPPPAPLPTPITTSIPIAPRLLPGQAPPAPEAIAQQQLQRGMRADQQMDRLNALDPRRPQQTGEGDVTSPDLRGDPSLPVMPGGVSPVFRGI
ncbi:hypothetical protein [Sediminicoccus sp. KRV36]|uniref:hypothetical protein n=1 Tax=Sediminicoccus sp. KRV36 TaxID=3133721 RepID=UPI00200CCB25|nr:hypothetical protein [Sediminicoccus rosea]UPY37364.1 hypothetical protein LHU95_01360 [Sediminicoccus rosea]